MNHIFEESIKMKAYLCLLILAIVCAAPRQEVFAKGGCGGATSTGKGFSCGASGSSSGTVTTVTTTTTTTTTTGGETGGTGHRFKSGSAAGTGPGLSGNLCSLLSNYSWGSNCNSGQYSDVGHHHKGGSTTTTTTQTFVICNNVIVSSAGITCTTRWSLFAHVDYPGLPIDTRPYPATLNRYPSVLRVDASPPR